MLQAAATSRWMRVGCNVSFAHGITRDFAGKRASQSALDGRTARTARADKDRQCIHSLVTLLCKLHSCIFTLLAAPARWLLLRLSLLHCWCRCCCIAAPTQAAHHRHRRHGSVHLRHGSALVLCCSALLEVCCVCPALPGSLLPCCQMASSIPHPSKQLKSESAEGNVANSYKHIGEPSQICIASHSLPIYCNSLLPALASPSDLILQQLSPLTDYPDLSQVPLALIDPKYNLDLQSSRILDIFPTRERSSDLVSLLQILQRLLQQEESLFPVRSFGKWSSGEEDFIHLVC